MLRKFLKYLPVYLKINTLQHTAQKQLLLNAKCLSLLNRNISQDILHDISKAEFSVYSQWGDDGIIQFLVNYLDIKNKVFVEFGVESYIEANTRYLLINDNWSGLVIDGSDAHIESIKNDEIYWKYDLNAISYFINSSNINHIIKNLGNISGEIGLLHIDIDGNDYWVWKEINVIDPIIVIVEYNSFFGAEKPLTIPYDPNFQRTKAHYSDLYYGTSLLSLCDLAEEKGYSFIGSNSAGNNAYFVKNDKLKGLKTFTAEAGFVNSKFRESKDKNGNLTYLCDIDKLEEIKGLKVFNTRSNAITSL